MFDSTANDEDNALLLVVDDRPDNLFVLRQLVAEHLPGCSIVVARSAAEGMALALEQIPDGVLADVQMPGVNGIELCRQLKEEERTAHIPVLLLTAHRSGPELKAEGLNAGADGFISKPIDNVELMARIKVMLRIKRAEDALRGANLQLAGLVNTRTQALREHQDQWRTLVEIMGEGLGMQDQDGVFVDVNNRFCAMLGYARSEIIGQPATAFLDETGRDSLAHLATDKHGRETYELEWLGKDGRRVPTLVSPVPLLYVVNSKACSLSHRQQRRPPL